MENKKGKEEEDQSITARLISKGKRDNEHGAVQYCSPHRFVVSSRSLLVLKRLWKVATNNALRFARSRLFGS